MPPLGRLLSSLRAAEFAPNTVDFTANNFVYFVMKTAEDRRASCNLFRCRQHTGRAQLRRLVAGFSPRIPGFAPRSIHVGFVVKKVALAGFSPSPSVFPCEYHYTTASYSLIRV
jgi:hypothetical protein